jgi:hypothetical protein
MLGEAGVAMACWHAGRQQARLEEPAGGMRTRGLGVPRRVFLWTDLCWARLGAVRCEYSWVMA